MRAADSILPDRARSISPAETMARTTAPISGKEPRNRHQSGEIPVKVNKDPPHCVSHENGRHGNYWLAIAGGHPLKSSRSLCFPRVGDGIWNTRNDAIY